MKLVFKLLFSVIVIVLVLAMAGLFYLDRIIKLSVEEVGPEVTGTPITLDDVSLSLMDGTGSLSGLTIANPSGFESPSIIRLGNISIRLDRNSLLSDVILVHSIDIVAPELTYEAAGSGSNLAVLQNNIERLTGSGSASGSSTDANAKKVIIERLTVSQGEIEVIYPTLSSQGISVALPDIVMTDIGQKSGGATVAEVATQLLEQLSQSAQGQVLKENALQSLGIDLDSLQESGNRLDEARGALEGLLDAFGN